MMKKKILTIVVTFNRLNLLKKCIKNILIQEYKCDILIVDNCSIDGTEKYINKIYGNNERIIYYKTEKNLGGAGGFNIGIRFALEHNYDFVWLMDDDCIPLKNTLKCFIDYDAQSIGKYGFLSSKVLWKDNSICKMNIQRKNMYINVKNFNDDVVKITMASFVSLFIPINIIKDVGLPIKEFFLWTDDWEYTRRISLKYNCFLLNKSIVLHETDNNIGANIVNTTEKKLNRFKYLYRNDVYLYRREGIGGYLYELIRVFIHIIKVMVFSKSKKIERIKIIIISTWKGMFFHPPIEKK